MRTLLLLRGAMGSGKSTWIKDNNLEPYTLEADRFRMLVCNPKLNENGDWHITQKNDAHAWNMLLKCLEERMKEGHFTVIDATHNNPKLVNKYKDLADKYKYNIFYYQPEATLKECLDRQKTRDQYKAVPEDAVRRAYSLIENVPLPNWCKRIHSLSEIDNYYCPDLTGKFERIKIFGDIHGCYTALTDAVSKDFDVVDEGESVADLIKRDAETLYIFVGDYVDRGIENYQTLTTMMKIADYPNVILLEGNHDQKPYLYWANGNGFESKSRYFLKNTVPELLAGIGTSDENSKIALEFKKQMRKFYRKLKQAYAFYFNGQHYLATHGGLTSVPKLTYISTQELVKGVGDYETDVGAIYDENYKLGKCQNFIQFHGHRGVTSGQYSYCLESEVEFGGYLTYAILNKGGSIYPDICQVKNKVFKERSFSEEYAVNSGEGKFKTENEEVNELLNSRLIHSKVVEPNLISINFKNSTFRKGAWNKLSTQARGLFVDKVSGEVKMRSYPKFFNLGERKETEPKQLRQNLKFPCKVYEKYNGFLGIMSVVDGELLLASKTTTVGPYADMFRELWNRENPQFKELVKNTLSKYNASLVFEVIHNDDPHIIDYGGREGLVILDAVENKLSGTLFDDSFSKKVVGELIVESVEMADLVSKLKDRYATVQNYEQLAEVFTELDKAQNEQAIEGVVVVDSSGFMFKYKAKFYADWKRRRSFVDKYRKLHPQRFTYQLCRDEEDVVFMSWLGSQSEDVIFNSNIIQLRKMFFENLKD